MSDHVDQTTHTHTLHLKKKKLSVCVCVKVRHVLFLNLPYKLGGGGGIERTKIGYVLEMIFMPNDNHVIRCRLSHSLLCNR